MVVVAEVVVVVVLVVLVVMVVAVVTQLHVSFISTKFFPKMVWAAA